MSADSAVVLSGERTPVFGMASVREPELVDREQSERYGEAWDALIDNTLVEWGRDASALEDEDFVPPSLDIIYLGCELAVLLRNEGLPPPTRIVPDGEGGICFERTEGRWSESLNMYADVTVELLSFDDCRLVGRHRLT